MTNSRVSNFSVNKNNILGKLSDFYECCLAKYKLGNKENLTPPRERNYFTKWLYIICQRLGLDY